MGTWSTSKRGWFMDQENAKGKRKYIPVRIRFNTWLGGTESLHWRFMFFLFQAIEQATGLNQEVLHKRFDNRFVRIKDDPWSSKNRGDAPPTLWMLLKYARLESNYTFLFIFDQFEEFFTYPEVQQQEFKRQLAEVLYADVPTYVKQNEDKHTPEEITNSKHQKTNPHDGGQANSKFKKSMTETKDYFGH